MKAIIFLVVAVILTNHITQAQIRNAKTETVKIYGNCDTCKSAMDKAGAKNRLYKTDWNVTTKMAVISYDSKRVTSDDVLKEIALAGYDNEKYLAPDDAYSKLQGCCKYERENKVAVKVINNQAAELINQTHSNHTMQYSSSNGRCCHSLTSGINLSVIELMWQQRYRYHTSL